MQFFYVTGFCISWHPGCVTHLYTIAFSGGAFVQDIFMVSILIYLFAVNNFVVPVFHVLHKEQNVQGCNLVTHRTRQAAAAV